MKEDGIRDVCAWGLSVILAWAFIFTGWKTIFPSAELEVRFHKWGYNEEFAFVVGVAEVFAGVLVLIPRIASLGAIILSVIMIGAIYTHLTTHIGSPLFAIVLLLLASTLLVLRWPDFLLNPGPSKTQTE